MCVRERERERETDREALYVREGVCTVVTYGFYFCEETKLFNFHIPRYKQIPHNTLRVLIPGIGRRFARSVSFL